VEIGQRRGRRGLWGGGDRRRKGFRKESKIARERKSRARNKVTRSLAEFADGEKLSGKSKV